ncbi:AAA family ATPase [Streptomyces mirabilis]|uniref:caspase, EACC1-associated type n=1 Tax=Streptomyces mirabilis TaxID=68239 RepID=UPI003685D522
MPAVSRTLEELHRKLLTVCHVPSGSIRTLLDPPDARMMAAAITEEAQRARTVLLIYYMGHGLIGPGDELYLAATSTDRLTPGLAAHQALSLSALQQALTVCRASSVVVVLDCCFSGRARLGGSAPPPAIALPGAHGIYLLASAEQLALAPDDAEYTAFTGELINLLDRGDPRGPRLLTLDAAYDFLFRTMRAKGGPLPRRQAGDRSGDLVIAVNAAQPVPAADPEDEAGTVPGRCPYLGLEAFAVDDAELFYGREQLVEELLETAAGAVRAGQPVIVVGPSGAGKTSLLHAGLLAALRRGAPQLPGSTGWPWIVLTPGDDPVHALAAVLHPDGPAGADALIEDPGSAALLARQILQDRGHDRLVLVVDRLEELFTAGERERTAFCAALAALAADCGRTLVVMALRADFYGQAQALPHLASSLREHQVQAAPMQLEELRAAIEEPAATVGVRLDEGLADLVLHELDAVNPPGPQSGSLPLLSHALRATWSQGSGARLTVAGYRASGGVVAALATTADRVYGELDAGGQDALRHMLPRLVRIGDGTVDTGRPADRDALLDGTSNRRAAEDALFRLARERLLVLHERTVRLSHDALLRAWPRLRGWIDADRDWLRTRQQLTADAEVWWHSDRDPALLYRGSKLAAARESAANAGRARAYEPRLTEFLDTSLRQERRSARVRTAALAVLIVLFLLATAGGVTATVYQHQANSQRGHAVARLVATEAASLRDTQPGLAKQLSIAAYRMDPGISVAPLISMLETPGSYDSGDPVVDIARTSDGRTMALSTGLSVVLWKTPGGRAGTIALPGAGAVALSPDGRLLAALASPSAPASQPSTGKNAATVHLWSIADPAHPSELPVPHDPSPAVTALAFAPDGHLLALGTSTGAVRRWNLNDPASPRALAELTGPTAQVDSLAFAPGSRLLAASGTDSRVRLWDTADPARTTPVSMMTGSPPPTTDPHGTPHRVSFRADGTVLAGPGDGNSDGVRLWKLADPRQPKLLAKLNDDLADCRDQLISTAFSPGGDLLATPCGTQVHLWDTTDPAHTVEVNQLTEPDTHQSGAVPALFAPSRSPVLLLHATTMGVHVWDVTNAPRLGAGSSLGTSPSGFNLTAQFSGGSRRLLIVHGADRATLWDMSGLPPHRKLADLPGSGDLASGAAVFSPDGSVLASAERAGGAPAVRLRDTAHPKAVLTTLPGLANGVGGLAYSADGHVLAVSDTGDAAHQAAPSTVQLFNVSRPTQPRRLAIIHARAFHLAFSPHGRLLVGTFDDQLLLWDTSDARHPVAETPRRLTPGSLDAVPAFRGDGRLLAVTDTGDTVHLWSVEHNHVTAEPIGEIRALGTGGSLAFSPDDRTLAMTSTGSLAGFTGDTQGHIELWDVSDPAIPVWRASFGFNEADLGGESISYSPQSPTPYLAVTSSVVAVWNTEPSSVAGHLCLSAGDPISRAQWARYVPNTPFHAPCPARQ